MKNLPEQIRMFFNPWTFSALGLVFQSACQTTSTQHFQYPDENIPRIRLLCRSVYDRPEARHQPWEKVRPEWLFVSQDRVKVYFRNDRALTLPRGPNLELQPGKYRCSD